MVNLQLYDTSFSFLLKIDELITKASSSLLIEPREAVKFEEWLVLKSEKFYHTKDMRMFEDVVMKTYNDEEVKKGTSMTPALE